MMSYADAASYVITLIAITLAPGPVALLLLVRSAAKDISGAIGFGIGFALGGLIIITAVCFGLGVWLSEVPELFEYGKYVMLAYILWMAYGLWKSSFQISKFGETVHRSDLSSLTAGMAACFISPYMMLLFPLVLPELVDITQIELPDFALVAVLTFASLAVGSGVIIVFASQICRIVKSPYSMRVLNRSLAGALALGGCWLAFA
ncbi:MAG: LysE family transporter [Paracoccaceae bacterium]